MRAVRDAVRAGRGKAGFSEFRANFESVNEVNGPHLGRSLDVIFAQATMPLGPGDILVMATDGLTDLSNPEGRSWGNRNFLKALFGSISTREDATAIVADLVREIAEFGDHEPLMDDVTFVVVNVKRD